MSRAAAFLLLCAPTLAGCAMCRGTDDYNYAAYGGSWQRGEMSQGRVGSAFGFASDMAELPFDAESIVVPPNSFDTLPPPTESMSDQPVVE